MNIFETWKEKHGDEGLGDTVSRVVQTVSGGKIEECSSCQKRKNFLNELVSYSNRNK